MEKLIQIKSNDLKPLAGRTLISEPFMGDFYFGRAVILLIDHSNEGTFGVVMNKPSGTLFNSIVDGFPDFDAMVYIGGPVNTDNLYFIHTKGAEIPDSSPILPGLFWGGDLEVVKEMMTLGLIQKTEIRFFLGYSGWSPKQLDTELKRNSWIVSESNAKLLLQTKSEKMWNRFMQRMGPSYDLWRTFPVNPELN